MDHTYVDIKKVKTLESVATALASTMISIMTISEIHVQSLEIGTMSQEMTDRANTIIWDLKRLLLHHKNQLEDVLKLLPDTFDAQAELKKLMKTSRKKP